MAAQFEAPFWLCSPPEINCELNSIVVTDSPKMYVTEAHICHIL